VGPHGIQNFPENCYGSGEPSPFVKKHFQFAFPSKDTKTFFQIQRSMADESIQQTNLDLLGATQQYLRTRLINDGGNSTLNLLWERFYSIYDGLIRRFAVSRGLRGHDLDDCLQAVWMRIALRLGEFEHPGDRPGLRSWLYTIVRNESYDVLYRQRSHPVESLEQLREQRGEPVSPQAEAGDVLDRDWHKALLKKMLGDMRDEISPRNWRLLELRFSDGASPKVIGRELGLSPAEVRYRQSRLLKKLKRRAAALTGKRGSVTA
jgi:RNA polymerase sigma factor (sigma-70 family)